MKLKMKRLLGLFLSLALVLGMFPGMSLTAYAAEVESEEFTTNTGAGTYTGTHIKITGTASVDGDGDYIGNSNPWTIQGLSGETITRVDMTIGFYGGSGNVSHFRANHGKLSNINDSNGGGFSFIDVNSTSITIDCESNENALQIKKVVVYYSAGSSYSVTITAGSNMTKTEGSGAASQTGLSGAMTDVVYTANDGYYFPTDYSVAAVNGISVTRDSYTQITVSGTPTANATITLTAPTAKTTPDAPTTAAATDCTTADNNDGKLTGVTTAMEYKKSDAADWIAGTGSDITGLVPGTYYVRVKATDTTNASAYQELKIAEYTAPTYTVTYKVVNGTWSDDSTADKTENVQSGSKPASVPTGMKAASGYTGGAWDTNPAEATITGATTFTYTYVAKEASVVTKAPEAKTLTYNGQAQELVTAGEADGGRMYYAVTTENKAPTDENLYTTDIPAKTEAGTYYVWYKAVGTGDYADSAPGCVTAVIAENSKLISVKFIHIKSNGAYGVPDDIKEMTLEPTILIKDGAEIAAQSDAFSLDVAPGDKDKSLEVQFNLLVEKLESGMTVELSGLPAAVDKNIYSAGGDTPTVQLRYRDAHLNNEEGITVYLVWGPDIIVDETIVVHILPEDEIGAYKLLDDGTKEYLLFHTYDICMRYLGRDELCRGPERCFHKEHPYVNPFVK